MTRPTDAVDHIKNELTAFARLREGADAQPDQSAAYNPQEPQGLRLKDKEAALRQLWQEAEKNFRFEQARRRGLREAGGWIYLPEFEAPEFVWLLQAKGGREENRFGLRPPDNAFFGFVKALFELIFGLLFVFLEATTDAVKKTAGGGADNRDYNSGHDILSAVPG